MNNTLTTTDWNRINNTLSQAILEAGLLVEILGDLGIDFRGQYGDKHRILCPVHEGDAPNMQITLSGYTLPIRWTCFSHGCHEKYKPSLLGLVRGTLSAQQGREVRMKDAVAFLEGYVGQTSLLPQREGSRRPDPAPRPYPFSLTRDEVRGALTIPSRYFLERGFSAVVLDKFDVGDSAMLKRAVVPLYDDEGTTCVGYAARSKWPLCDACKKHHFGPDCRYGQHKWELPEDFPAGSYLFNYAAARETACPFVLLVEGVGDAIRVAEARYVAVAVLGSEPSVEQVRKLAALDKPVWVAFDNDDAGEKGRLRLREWIEAGGLRLRTEAFHAPAKYKDIGEVPAEELARAVEAVRREQLEELPF